MIATPGAGPLGSSTEAFRRVGLIVAVLVVGLLAWEYLLLFFKIPRYLVPQPSTIAFKLYDGFVNGALVLHTAVTLQEVVIGYVAGSVVGIVLGIFISQFKLVEDVAYPYVVALNAVPKVAIAPLIVVWFGYGLESKVVISALVSFFPLLVMVLLGLRSAEAQQITLMRSLTASRWQIFRMVLIPNALPAMFAGLEVAVVLSVVGAIVGEFVGSKTGLGYYIMFSNAVVDTAGMFAAIIVLAIIGYALNQVVRVVGRRVVFWREHDITVSS